MASVHDVAFFTKVKSELRVLFTHTPTWEATASATLTYNAPMVETLITLADPAALPAVSAAIARMQTAMAAAAVVIKAAGPTPTLVRYLNAINVEASELGSVAGFKDPQALTAFTRIVEAITTEVDAISTEVSNLRQAA